MWASRPHGGAACLFNSYGIKDFLQLVTVSHKWYTEPPSEGLTMNTMTGESWITTTFEGLEDWAQRNSFWPFPFGTACCAIEFMSTVSSHYDVSRFGSEVVRFSPRQSDVLLVAGTINDKMAPVLKKIYDQMADPKWVISMGACACSGGFYRAYHVMQGIDEIIPVDIYVPGCPPTPEGLIYGILQLKEKVIRDRKKHRVAARADQDVKDNLKDKENKEVGERAHTGAV
jgi:NADH-quinone oxidoreductase subunit B